MLYSAFTLGRPGTEASRARLGSGVLLSASQSHLYVICTSCLRHLLSEAQNFSLEVQLMTCLQQEWCETSASRLVKTADYGNAPARAQPESSRTRTEISKFPSAGNHK